MAKRFKITYVGDVPDETVEATGYRDVGDQWTDFFLIDSRGVTTQVLRVRSADVDRIEQV